MLRLRLTPAGASVVGAFLLLSSLAANPGQTLAYQAWALTSVLLFGAAVFMPFFRARLEVHRILPRFGTAGHPLRYRIRLKNLSARTQTGLDFGETLYRNRLDLDTFREMLRPGRRRKSFQLSAPLPPRSPARLSIHQAPVIPGNGSAEFIGELLPFQRGPLHFVGAWVGRTDPLGLLRSLCKIKAPATVMILPKRYPVSPQALPGSSQYQHRGVNFASGIGESEEFVGVREYRHGDSLRRIHWRVSARLDKPVVREYQDEYFVRHALVLDTFCDSSLDFIFEEAVAVAASFAYTVPDQDSLLDLLFVGPATVCVTAGRGVGNTEHMLEVLACARPCREPRVPDLARHVLQYSSRMSGCLLLLLEWDEPRREIVRALKALHIPVWVLLVIPPDADAPPPPESAEHRPDRWIPLKLGEVEEGLRKL
jgi:uncharacterized protein (DUF58 family)